MDERIELIMRAAREQYELIAAGCKDWAQFHRLVFGAQIGQFGLRTTLGLNGIVRTHFLDDTAGLRKFELTAEYGELLAMLESLRARAGNGERAGSQIARVMTVRWPQSCHLQWVAESHEHLLSGNDWAIGKLLRPLQPLPKLSDEEA